MNLVHVDSAEFDREARYCQSAWREGERHGRIRGVLLGVAIGSVVWLAVIVMAVTL